VQLKDPWKVSVKCSQDTEIKFKTFCTIPAISYSVDFLMKNGAVGDWWSEINFLCVTTNVASNPYITANIRWAARNNYHLPYQQSSTPYCIESTVETFSLWMIPNSNNNDTVKWAQSNRLWCCHNFFAHFVGRQPRKNAISLLLCPLSSWEAVEIVFDCECVLNCLKWWSSNFFPKSLDSF